MAKKRTYKRRFRSTKRKSWNKKSYVQDMMVEAVPLDDDTLRVDGTLKDPDHEIEVYIVVNVRTSEILDVGARMLRKPYPPCDKAMRKAYSIVGMKIQTGLYQKLYEAAGGPEGCVHLVDILMASCKMAANAILGVVVGEKNWDNLTDRDEEFHAKLMGAVEGMCLGFNPDSQSKKLVKKGVQ